MFCCSCCARWGCIPQNPLSWAFVILNWLIVSLSVLMIVFGTSTQTSESIKYTMIGAVDAAVGLLGVFSFWQLHLAIPMCIYNWTALIFGVPTFVVGAVGVGVGGFAVAFGSLTLVQVGGIAITLGFLMIATSLTGLVFGCLNWCGLARRKPRKKTLDELGEDDDGGFMGVGKKKKRIVRRTLDDDDDFQEPPLPRVYVDEPPEEPPKRPWWAFLVPSRKKDTQQGEDTDKPAKAAVSVKKPAPPGPPPSIAGTQKEGKGPFWPFGKASSALPPAPVALRQVPEKVVNYPPPPPELATMTTVEDAQPVWVWWTPPQASTKSVVVPLEMPSPPINATSASSIPLESGYLSQAGSAGLPPSNAAARAVRPPPPSESPAAKKKREKEEAAAEMDRSNFARQRMAYGAAPAEIEMDLVQPGGPVPHPADHDRIEVVVIDPGSVTADMATGKGKGKGKGAMNRPDSIAITEDHDTRKKKQFKDLEAQSEEGEGGPRSGSFLFRLTHGNNQPQRAQPNNIFHAKPDLTT